MNIDTSATLMLASIAGMSDVLDSIVVIFAQWAIFVPVLTLLILPFVRYDREWRSKYSYLLMNTFFVGVVLALLNIILGTLAFRLRPFVVYGLPAIINTSWLDNAFPSVHAMIAFLVAMTFFYIKRVFGVGFLILAGFISLARVIAGVHFLSDVIAGATLGIIGAYVIRRFFLQKLSQ